MKSDQKNKHRVNWIDGMKINKDHFVQQENAMLENIRHSVQRNSTPVNYGLLPDFSDQGSAMDISISVDGQSTIEVVLNACQAITPGGYQIDINGGTKKLLEQSGFILKQQYDINKEETEWYIVLSVNPDHRIPVGDADPDEEPPRHPYVFPEYKLDILPKSETSAQELGQHHLTIGKVITQDGKPLVDADFIPPCCSIQSHADLRFTYQELGAFLNDMEGFSLHIIQKIHHKKQTNELAKVALYLTEQVLHYLNAAISEFRFKDKYEPPVVMISKIVSLGRVIKGSLDVFVGTEKEKFLNYLTDVCDLNQGTFDTVLVRTVELEYVHKDINSALLNISDFTKLMLTLFKKMSELEYIGKKKDKDIFVKEEPVENTEVKGRRSFLLD